MDEFLRQLNATGAADFRGFSLEEFLIGLIASAILSMVVSLVYRKTHTGLSYSRSFVLSIIIMSVTVCFIMLIIGSNLARAFSLVGALSIVRYRNAVKDTQDISYIFLAIAVGMACGTKLYGMAVIFTFFSGGLMLLLDKVSFGSEGRVDRLMQFTFLESNEGYFQRIEDDLNSLTKGRNILLSTEYTGEYMVVTYEADIPNKRSPSQILGNFRENYSDLDVKILSGFDQFNV
jgi:uncharacterized membrane protein YhiD involved in acid resistance